MSKHTPGPWVCETAGPFPTITTDSPDYPNQTVADTCASVAIFHVSGREDNHAEANARLIAAAPDLLSLVRRFIALPIGAWHPERHAADEMELAQDAQRIVGALAQSGEAGE